MSYLLDANVFITAKNLHYGMDFCPAFWDWVVDAHHEGKVHSVEKVADELSAGEDELSDWASTLGDDFFMTPDADTLRALVHVSRWISSNGYEPAAINTFLSGADYYLISEALARGHTVVTHEKPSDSTKRIKIPNVCLGLGVKVVSPFEMLRRERARFVLDRQPAADRTS